MISFELRLMRSSISDFEEEHSYDLFNGPTIQPMQGRCQLPIPAEAKGGRDIQIFPQKDSRYASTNGSSSAVRTLLFFLSSKHKDMHIPYANPKMK